MGRLNKGLIGVVLAGALPIAASAQTAAPAGPQTPLPANTQSVQIATPSTPNDQPAAVGGIPNIDFINLGTLGPGAPLRFGNVIPNSEFVQLNGVPLEQNVDYFMDYAVGVVYLKVAQSAGQQLTVSYRYRPSAALPPGAVAVSAPLSASSYSLLPGVNLLTDFGVVQRGSGGAVMNTNILGMSDSFKFSDGISVNGLYMLGMNQRDQNFAGMDYDLTQNGPKPYMRGGGSQLILQDVKDSHFFGGTLDVDYQSISQNFMGFSSLPGYDAATAARLNNERGLTRFGYDAQGVQLGSFVVSDSYHDVRDESGGIYWRSADIQNGGFNAQWNSQQVGQAFNRFANLSEANHNQLAAESGMSRNNVSVNWAKDFGKITYESDKIDDDESHTGIKHEAATLDTSKLHLNLGDDSVDAGFSKFGSLLFNEQLAYSSEAGIHREWFGLQSPILGVNAPLSFNQTTLTSPAGEFKAQDAAIGGQTWSLEHVDRNIGAGFVSLGAMSGPEVDANVRSIGNMYLAARPGPQDDSQFLASSGLDRQYTAFTDTAWDNWKIKASDLELSGLKDTGRVDAFTAASKNVILNFRQEDLGSRFAEVTNMMDFEQAELGALAGLQRTDMDATVVNGKTKLEAETMNAETLTGSASRGTLSYDDPNKLDVQVGARSVTNSFQDAESLVDPERELLDSLRGFNEDDVKLRWVIQPGSTLDTFDEAQYNPETREYWRTNNTIIDTMVGRSTEVNITDLEQHNNDPVSRIFSSVVDKMSVIQNMGSGGILKVLTESDAFDGVQRDQLDDHTNYIGYQNNITATTSVKTEATHTVYADGTTEDIAANSVAQQLSKRTGVSVTDTDVKRTGASDENHQNMGFWYDLGNGVKLSYGYLGDIMPSRNQDDSSQAFTLSKGAPVAGQPPNPAQAAQVGNLMMNGAYYVNQWNAQDRTQTNGNLALATAKPFRIGPIQDAKFVLNMDTGTDYSRLTHEDKLIQGSGRYGSYQFGYEYKSQMDPTGNRAIDRTVKFMTDPSAKKFLSGAVSYKARTMPDDSIIIIRDYNITMRPAANVTVVNLLQTNPDIANPGAILGSIPQAQRSDKWTLDYKTDPNLTVGAAYQELIDDSVGTSSQTAGVTAKLFTKTGSPLMLFYGLEDADQTDLWRKTQRYSLQYDQRTGPNQTFSLFMGNVSYLHAVPIGQGTNNNTFRLNYQYRF